MTASTVQPCGWWRTTCASVSTISWPRRRGRTPEQIRTVAAWGKEAQNDLARLRAGIIGGGSVGGMIGEALVRIGLEQDVMVIDFDKVEEHNLDRLVYATRADIGRPKIDVMAEHLSLRGTAETCRVEAIMGAVYEEPAFRRRSIAMCCSHALTDHGAGTF